MRLKAERCNQIQPDREVTLRLVNSDIDGGVNVEVADGSLKGITLLTIRPDGVYLWNNIPYDGTFPVDRMGRLPLLTGLENC